MSLSYGTCNEDEERAAFLRPRTIVPPAPPTRDRSSSKRRAIVGASIAFLGASAIATCAYVSSNTGAREVKVAPMNMEARNVAASLVAQVADDEGATFESLDINSDGVITKTEYVSRLEKRRDDVLAKLNASNLADDVKTPVAAIITENFNSEVSCVSDIFKKSGGDGADRETFEFVHPLILSICKKSELTEAVVLPSTTAPPVPEDEEDDTSAPGSKGVDINGYTPSATTNGPSPDSPSVDINGDTPEPTGTSEPFGGGTDISSTTGEEETSNDPPSPSDTKTPSEDDEPEPDVNTPSVTEAKGPSPTTAESSNDGDEPLPSGDVTATPAQSSDDEETAQPPTSNESGSSSKSSQPSKANSGEGDSPTTDDSSKNEGNTPPATTDEDTESPSPSAEENPALGGSTATDSPSTEASDKGGNDTPSTDTDEDTESQSPVSTNAVSGSQSSPDKTEGSTENEPTKTDGNSSSTSPGPASSGSEDVDTNPSPAPSAAGGSSQADSSNADDTPSPSTRSTTSSGSNESNSPSATVAPTESSTSSSNSTTPQPELVSDIKEALADLNMTLPGEGSQGTMQSEPQVVQKFLGDLTSSSSENGTQSVEEKKSPERLAFEESLRQQFVKEIAEHSQRLAYAKLQIKKNAFMLELVQECVTQAGRRFEMDSSFSQEKAASWMKDVCLTFPSLVRHEDHA